MPNLKESSPLKQNPVKLNNKKRFLGEMKGKK